MVPYEVGETISTLRPGLSEIVYAHRAGMAGSVRNCRKCAGMAGGVTGLPDWVSESMLQINGRLCMGKGRLLWGSGFL